MGATKKHFYTHEQIEMATIFKALGHPARITIVELLLKNENLCCKDISEYIPLAQSTISRHLNVLYETGILGYEVIGNHCFYRVNPLVLEEVVQYANELLEESNPKYLEMFNTYFKPRAFTLMRGLG